MYLLIHAKMAFSQSGGCDKYIPFTSQLFLGLKPFKCILSVRNMAWSSPSLHLLSFSLFPEEAHQCGKGLLIHCQAGVSRSATIVIAYLMKHTRMTMTDAYKFVKGKRPIISPNLNFMGQLLEFEEDLNNGVTPRILTPKLMGVETVVWQVWMERITVLH